MRSVSDSFKERKNKVGDKITPIYLYSIQYDEVGNRWMRLAGYSTDIVFDGITYQKYTVVHNGTRENLNGRIDKVTLSIGNVDRVLQYYLDTYDGLKGKKVILSMVWLENLDLPECVISDEYYIEDSTSYRKAVSLTLASSLDVLDVQLPRRSFYRYYCRFLFKGQDCGYAGAEGVCNKTFNRCQELGNTTRFGGFPGIPMKRMLVK